MKKFKRLVLVLALVMMLSAVAVPGVHAASNGWAWQQEVAHQIAELARSLGLPENHPLLAICGDLWWAYHDGSDPSSIGVYTSNRTGASYGYGNGYYNNNYYRGSDLATGMSYRYSGYIWYQSRDNYNMFFRIENQKLVWATDSQNANIPNGTFQGYNKYPADGYYENAIYTDMTARNNGTNSSYGGKALYNGVITGVDGYINAGEATCLAKLMYTAAHAEASTTKVAAVGWSVVDAIGVGNITSSRLKTVYGFYDDNAATSDATRDYLALAKDILFRRAAEKAGMAYVGRVIPNTYTYVYQNGDGTANVYNNSSFTNAYTFPNMWQNGVLRTPYSN